VKYREQSHEFRIQKNAKETRLIFYLKRCCLARDDDGEREEVFDRIDTIRGEEEVIFSRPRRAAERCFPPGADELPGMSDRESLFCAGDAEFRFRQGFETLDVDFFPTVPAMPEIRIINALQGSLQSGQPGLGLCYARQEDALIGQGVHPREPADGLIQVNGPRALFKLGEALFQFLNVLLQCLTKFVFHILVHEVILGSRESRDMFTVDNVNIDGGQSILYKD